MYWFIKTIEKYIGSINQQTKKKKKKRKKKRKAGKLRRKASLGRPTVGAPRPGRRVGACTRANELRIPEAIASLLPVGKDCIERQATRQEQERSSPVRAICIQRPRCRERGEVAINNATHHQYLAGITARTPIHQQNEEKERQSKR